MRTRWLKLCELVGTSPAAGPFLFSALERLYKSPPRGYHSLEHIRACLATFDTVCGLATDAAAVEFAIFLHDCVYEARRSDNECRSAEVAAGMLVEVGAPAEFIGRVEGLILATRHRGPGLSPDEQLLMDIDMAILGADERSYDTYAAAIRREYSFATDAQFADGRAAFLQGLLARAVIFQTECLKSRLEGWARLNIGRELAALKRSTVS